MARSSPTNARACCGVSSTRSTHRPQRIDRAVDRIVPEIRDLERAQDGSEVSAHELETLTERAQNLGDRRDAFEKMRDLAAEGYRVETGETWRPRHGSHTSRTGVLNLRRHRRPRLRPRPKG